VETPPRPSAEELLGRLAASGYLPLLGPAIDHEQHGYGNVLLSRLPMLAFERVDLSVPGREPRGLIDARFGPLQAGADAPGHLAGDGRPPPPTLRCLATHLGLDRGERQWQIARIAEVLDEPPPRPPGSLGSVPDPDLDPDLELRPAACCHPPTLLLGDFNEWRPGPRLRPLDRRLHRAHTPATWHARWPLLALDRVWYCGLRLKDSRVPHTGPARRASDHLPLVACFELPPPGAVWH
jgi:endonuclease/exonuclease/phosphatase family metal-dependent hydrolase